jgi:hypothetical protein
MALVLNITEIGVPLTSGRLLPPGDTANVDVADEAEATALDAGQLRIVDADVDPPLPESKSVAVRAEVAYGDASPFVIDVSDADPEVPVPLGTDGRPWDPATLASDSELAAAILAINGRFRGPYANATGYKAKDIVVNPSGQMVYATADFTSAGAYNAANWTQLTAGSTASDVTSAAAGGITALTVQGAIDQLAALAGGGGVPKAVALPVITGTPQVGQTLTGSPGSWISTLPMTPAYRWRRDGASIRGGNLKTYKLTDFDQGHAITCTVTMTNGSGAGVAVTSDPVTCVEPPIAYSLREQWANAEGPPLGSPHVAVPGPNRLGYTDVVGGADAQVAASKYSRGKPATNLGYGNYGAYSLDPITRDMGVAAYAVLSASDVAGLYAIGVRDTAGLGAAGLAMIWQTQNQLDVEGAKVVRALSLNTAYEVMQVARPLGYLYFIRGGTEFPSWTLLMVTSRSDGALARDLFVQIPNNNSAVDYDELGVLRRRGALGAAFGGATLTEAFPIGTWVGLADALIYLTWTPVAGEVLELSSRYVDDSNRIRVRYDQAAGTVRVYRHNADAVGVELDTSKAQTFTPGTPYRLALHQFGGDIWTFVGTGDMVAKHLITGETFNQFTPGVKVAGAAATANLEVWPRTFAGTDQESIAA